MASNYYKKAIAISALFGLAYLLVCGFLTVRQRHFIYRPSSELSSLPSSPDFNIPYETVWMPVRNEKLYGWWMPADATKSYSILAEEPAHVLTEPKTVLYFCGVGNNIGDYNYLSRMASFRQLGFSVLAFDYRGYGLSEGKFPSEAQLYEDGRAAWDYLRDMKGIPAEDILLYGESLGGAIALDLAIEQPNAGGLIMQSSFTSMAEAVKQKKIAKAFPTDRMLSEQLDSIGKIEALDMPVLFLHGSRDSVVPSEMSHRLYEKASEPKSLFIISKADHVSIYRAGEASYLKAIRDFMHGL